MIIRLHKEWSVLSFPIWFCHNFSMVILIWSKGFDSCSIVTFLILYTLHEDLSVLIVSDRLSLTISAPLCYLWPEGFWQLFYCNCLDTVHTAWRSKCLVIDRLSLTISAPLCYLWPEGFDSCSIVTFLILYMLHEDLSVISLTVCLSLFQHRYAIRDLKVFADCACNGHNTGCTKSNVTGQYTCVCGDNTEGDICQRCKPFYNQLKFSNAYPCESKYKLTSTNPLTFQMLRVLLSKAQQCKN